ncbi:MAG: helix-turn-helix domain-containing protein [Gallionella sp.]|jgi:HTH-type transcriptional regulator/antitoxin HigA
MSLAQEEKSEQTVDSSIAQIWGDLQQRLGLSAIHNQTQYDHMVRLMNSLADEIGDNEEHPLADLLEIVGDIIAAYEERHYPISDAEPREVLRLLMEQNNLQQKDLAGDLGSQSVVSEILNGKRGINARQAKVLATRFAISPGAFL